MTPWYRLRAARKTAELLIYQEIAANQDTSRNLVNALEALGPVEEITVRINSPGGDVFEALAVYNALLRFPARIIVRVDALCASAATVVAMAGDEIRMADNAMWMIHEPKTIAIGTREDLTRGANVLESINDQVSEIYIRRTGASSEQIMEWMKAETWFTAAEALAAGFIDAIDESMRIAALAVVHSVDGFKNFPKPNRNMEMTEQLNPELSTEITAPAPEAPEAPPAHPEAIDAISLSRLCIDAGEPGLIPILLAGPRTAGEIRDRLRQAAEIRRICAVASQPEAAAGFILAGMDETAVKCATWNNLVARAETARVDNVPSDPIPADLPFSDKCQAEWNRSPQLRAEFRELNAYTAWRKANDAGRATILGSKSV